MPFTTGISRWADRRARARLLGHAHGTSWAIRNCATMLFGAVLSRVLGSHRNTGTLTQGLTAAEFFGRYPPLRAVLRDRLAAAVAASRARAVPAGLFALLALLARLAMGTTVASAEQAAPFVPLVAACLHNPLYHVRSMAAHALLPLLPTPAVLPLLDALLAQTLGRALDAADGGDQGGHGRWPPQNSLDGVLRAATVLLRGHLSLLAAGAVEGTAVAVSTFISGRVLRGWTALATAAGNPCAATRALYLELLVTIQTAVSSTALAAVVDAAFTAAGIVTAARALATAPPGGWSEAVRRELGWGPWQEQAVLLALPSADPATVVAWLAHPAYEVRLAVALAAADARGPGAVALDATAVPVLVTCLTGTAPEAHEECQCALIRWLTRIATDAPELLDDRHRAALVPVVAMSATGTAPSSALSVRCAALPLLVVLTATPTECGAAVAAVAVASHEDQVRRTALMRALESARQAIFFGGEGGPR